MNIFRKIFRNNKVGEDNSTVELTNSNQNDEPLSPIQMLLNEIKGKGRDEYPFLHPTYNPYSRIPCVDFTPFIKGRLLVNDINSIVTLMKEIIRANPGVGIGVSWIEKSIRNILNIDFKKYINYESSVALTELKTFWILAEKSGGGREFWITERESFTKLLSVVLGCFSFKLTEDFPLLVKSANHFIKTMRRDTPYWRSFPLYETIYPIENKIPSSEFTLKYNTLTIGGRLTLYDALSKQFQSLYDCSKYNHRSLGINSLDSIDEIICSEILLTEKCIAEISPLEYLNRKELINLLDSKAIAYKKSWDKNKLFNTIIEKNNKVIEEFMSDKQKERIIIKYKINPIFISDVEILLKSIEETKIVYNLLCFIESKY